MFVYTHLVWFGILLKQILYANKTQKAYFHFLGLICHVDCQTNYSWVMLLLCCSLVDVSLQGRMWVDMMMHRRVDKHLDAMQTTSWGGLSNHISPSEHHKCAYIWIHMPLRVIGQRSNHRCHIYARCKLADNHWVTTLCVCATELPVCPQSCHEFECRSVCVCASRFISVWVFVHDWLLCLPDHNWKGIHLSPLYSLPPLPLCVSIYSVPP